jgi:hypothetical protein
MVSGLTVGQSANSVLRGVILRVDENLEKALAVREGDDSLVPTPAALDTGETVLAELFVTQPHALAWASDQCPICMSYLDCVLQGYFQIYGRDGIEHVLDTTEGWHLPICDDRAVPRYPRAVTLDPRERLLIETCLKARGILQQ